MNLSKRSLRALFHTRHKPSERVRSALVHIYMSLVQHNERANLQSAYKALPLGLGHGG